MVERFENYHYEDLIVCAGPVSLLLANFMDMQGINTGFTDAEFLAIAMDQKINHNMSSIPLELYKKVQPLKINSEQPTLWIFMNLY